MPDDTVSASAKGATFLILLQIGSRAVTFALNQILLRFLSPEILGVSIQLELYKIGVLFFSRESLRVATERRSDGGVQAVVNLSYLAIAAGLPIGFGFAQSYLSMGLQNVPFFAESLRVNELATFIELLMEPAFVAVQQNLLFKTRAAAEATSVVVKTFVVFGTVFWGRSQGLVLGVLPFAIGELANATTQTTVYWTLTSPEARKRSFSLFPRKMKSSLQTKYAFSLFSQPLLHLIASLYFQTGIKWVLTEGDKLLVAAFASLEDQGMYALSANYGGLIARMLFQPIENSSRNLFANLCATPPQQAHTKRENNDKNSKNPNAPLPPTENTRTAATILRDILRPYTNLSLAIFTLGPTAAPILLHLVAGARWTASGAGDVLAVYCYYIPLLAVNGVSEAFVAATASTGDLHRQSLWMAGFSVVFAGSAWVFLRVLGLGAVGLVGANCVNMAMRIVFNLAFVKGYFARRGVDFNVGDIFPSTNAVSGGALVVSMLVGSRYVGVLQSYGMLGDIGRVAVAGLGVVVNLWLHERSFLIDCYRRFRA